MPKALFVGRFQPLHTGHLDAIEQIRRDGYKPMIGIGSPNAQQSLVNPFSAEERREMLLADVKGDYELVPIPDVGHDGKWMKQIEAMNLGFDVVYTGNPNTRMIFEEAGYKTIHIEERIMISGTKVRGLMFAGRNWQKWVGSGTAKYLKRIDGEEIVRKFPEGYKHFGPKLTVDAIIEREGKIPLIERGHWPYIGMLALPGGHVDYGEHPDEAVIREVKEETNLDFIAEGVVGVYSDVERDPRGWYCTIVYHGSAEGEMKAGDDAKKVVEVDMDKLPDLAFDHSKILSDYKGRQIRKA